MQKKCFVALAIVSAVLVRSLVHGQYADSVASYTPGSGFAANFTNAGAALGAPASAGSVTPFAPPFSNTQIVSLGAGGSLTLHLSTSIVNDSANPFGLDFMIFGNSGFVITNGDFSGGGITDGSLFGNNTGVTRVEVSGDGSTWFTLNPALAPVVDGLFPTDATGNARIPVDPTLTRSTFAGLGLSGIRLLYHGSAGGTGFDLAWAQDELGNPASLLSADYVRIGVLTGKSEIDAVSVVPEPSLCALAILGAGVISLRWRKWAAVLPR